MTNTRVVPRVDERLVELEIVGSLREARGLIMAGRVLATDLEGRERRIEKPGERVPSDWTFRLKGEKRRFVSRAGEKLEAALDSFGIDVADRICADIGLSTGGFTDCLLSRGARRVHGVDVAYGTVDLRLRQDPRLVLYERTNARTLGPNAFGEWVDLAVFDVSFISVTAVMKPVAHQLRPQGSMVILVKPQFEAAREDVGPGGIVTDATVRTRAADSVAAFGESLGYGQAGRMKSPISGTRGNVELLLHLARLASDPA